ncbi:MaoC family dehydratase N-terminal domain-containing protein [Peptoniphilus sp. EMRHCC_23]|uniref:MaoC/PaaZ C-terminal domain-containing protein n=1 Tax=Peptoniphilus TaxID=162289 RepID=UPI001BFFF88A|nr:MaoC/PaaZ C-terminal domain-containing protein [Peptoniphilus rachelemmaiella]
MYLEDYVVGLTFQTDPFALTEKEIIDYARAYDDRPFHTDPEAAKKSRFGTIIASGLHSLSATWGHWVATGLDCGGVVAGIGMNHLRWVNPIYPGVDLYTTIVVDGIEIKSDGDYGVVHMIASTRDESGTLLLEHDVLVLVASRHARVKKVN